MFHILSFPTYFSNLNWNTIWGLRYDYPFIITYLRWLWKWPTFGGCRSEQWRHNDSLSVKALCLLVHLLLAVFIYLGDFIFAFFIMGMPMNAKTRVSTLSLQLTYLTPEKASGTGLLSQFLASRQRRSRSQSFSWLHSNVDSFRPAVTLTHTHTGTKQEDVLCVVHRCVWEGFCVVFVLEISHIFFGYLSFPPFFL